MSEASSTVFELDQFQSFRDIVHDRIDRRQMRTNCRRGYSETQNEIDREMKAVLKGRKSELDLLRSSIESGKEEIQKLKAVAESVPPNSIYEESQSQNKGLEAEVMAFRRCLPNSPEPATPTTNQDFEDDLMDINAIDESFLNGEFDANVTGIQTHNSSYLETPPETPRRPRYVEPPTTSVGIQSNIPDPENVVLQESVKALKKKLHDLSGSLEETAQSHHRLLTKLGPFLEARSPPDTPPTLDEALDTLLTAIVLAESKSQDAEIALNTLRSEVSDLSLEGETAGEVLQNLQILFRDARLELEYLAPGENAEGFENNKLFSMLVERAKRLQQDIRHRDELLDTQRTRDAVLYEQINVKNKIVDDLKGRVFELENEKDERDRSICKLQQALDGYRKEVQSLERLVERLEMDHNLALARKDSDADEAVADLDSRLIAEIQSREEAESEASMREKAVEALRQKLQNATKYAEAARNQYQTMLAGKQVEIENLTVELRRREHQHGANLAARDEKLLSLRKQSDDLFDKLTEARERIMSFTAANAALENQIVVEKETSAQILKEKHAKWMEEVDALKRNMANDYLRGHQIDYQSAEGSSTPSDDGDDFVKPRLGFVLSSLGDGVSRNIKSRRRWDSGIGVVEEDDNEPTEVGRVA